MLNVTRRRSRRQAVPILAIVTLAASLGGCASSGASTHDFAPPHPPPLPGPPGAALLAAPEGEPEELSGVDIGDLVARERHTWWQLVSQLYAPCADQPVSIAQCVREERQCPACVHGARLLAAQVKRGASTSEAQAAYAVRFGPDVKKVDLADSPAIGPADAPVQIVVWSDYECPACGRAVPLIEEAYRRHAPHVRLIHKLYPLKVHKHAEAAARAAFAAAAQGRYWPMERLMFENQHALEDQDLLGYARKLGLDLERFRADMASDRAAEVIARDREAADRAGLQGTPFILINGRELDLGLFSLETDIDPWIRTEIDLAGGSVK